ncbi:MAG: GGDEF domain-containing protein [Coriobacteriia bacterium]|nr:GGDEF domain-containing protein [Coriobacteriia bacterium]
MPKLVGFGVAVLLVSVAGIAFCGHEIRTVLENDTVQKLDFTARSVASTLDNQITLMQSKLNTLQISAKLADPFRPLNEKMSALAYFGEQNNLVRGGIVDINGSARTYAGAIFDASNSDWFKGSKDGNATISNSAIADASSGKDIVTIAQPLYWNGTIVGVSFISQYTAEYLSSPVASLTDGEYKVNVVDENRRFLLKDRGNVDFLQQVKRETPPRDYQKLVDDLTNQQAGVASVVIKSQGYEVAYHPLMKQNGWSIVAITQTRNANSYVEDIFTYLDIFGGVIAVLLFVLVETLVIEVERKHMKEAESLPFDVETEENLRAAVPQNERGVLERIECIKRGLAADELAVIGILEIESLSKFPQVYSRRIAGKVVVALSEKLASFDDGKCAITSFDRTFFVISCAGFHSRRECREYIQDIEELVNEPIRIDELVLTVTMHMGAHIYHKNPENGKDAQGLLDVAKRALDEARSTRKGLVFYSQAMEKSEEKSNFIQNNLPFAIAHDELQLVYQPQFDLRTQKMTGVEALLRWHSAEYGVLLPREFLPIAESEGHILEIGRWVVDEVFKDAAAHADRDLVFSFNASPLELFNPGYVSYVIEKFTHYGLKQGSVAIEFSEEGIVDILEQVFPALETLRAAGLLVYIDQFGSQIEALVRFANAPLDAIKIEGRYYESMELDIRRRMLVECSVDFGNKLGIHVMAQDVMTDAQEQSLINKGCEKGQGYLLSRPLPLDVLMQLPLVS